MAARLSHPGIVVVHDVGRDAQTGLLYLAFERLHGRTLDEKLAGGALPWREAFELARHIAAALQQQPDLAELLGHLIILGGTLAGPGNVTAAAEFNIYCNADAARLVFRSPVTKTVVPIDLTSRIVLNLDLLEKLPEGASHGGGLLRQLLPGAFRAYRQQLGLEGIHLHDTVAIVAAMRPDLFTTERMHGDVETEGTLTYGATVFDRRRRPESQPNIDVAVDMDTPAVADLILRGLTQAA